MTNHERNATEWFCKILDGQTVYEYEAVKKNKLTQTNSRRLDALVVNPGSGYREVGPGEISLENCDVVVVLTKARHLGMNLAGQAFFSREILRDAKARSLRSVAVCKETDGRIEPLLVQLGIEVIEAPASVWP